jgi:hypothetical protein
MGRKILSDNFFAFTASLWGLTLERIAAQPEGLCIRILLFSDEEPYGRGKRAILQ